MLNSNPLVSVIIPAYNAENYLQFSVKSVLDQTYKNIEIIIVNDGSTDKTIDIAEELALKFNQIKVFNQKNGKQAKARNTGIKASRGEIIAFIDADDEWLPEKLEIQVKKLIDLNVDLVYSDGLMIFTNEMLPLSEIVTNAKKKYAIESYVGEISGEEGKKLIHRKNRLPTTSVICKKEAIVNVGYFNENKAIQNCEDYLLWATLVNKGYKLYGIPEKLIYYRVHEQSSTMGFKKQLFPLIQSIYLIQNPLTKELKTQLAVNYRTLLNELVAINEFQEAFYLFDDYNEKVAHPTYAFILKLLHNLKLHSLYLKVFWRDSKLWLSEQEI
jgi:glycosyltransferase involved in cell wall biosynthesis